MSKRTPEPQRPTAHTVWVAALALCALAAALRFVHLREIAPLGFFAHPLSDGRVYDQRAQGIASGDWLGPADFVHAPLYAYVLGIVEMAVGHDLWRVRAAQIVLGSLTCVLVFLAGRKLFGFPAALLAGALLAIYPPAIFFDTLIQKAGLELFLAALLLATLAALTEAGSSGRWLAAGAALGLLVLTRQNALVLVPLLLAWVWLGYRIAPVWYRGVWSVAVLLGLAVPLLPWALRNYCVTGAFVLTTPNLGQNFAMGNHPDATGTYLPFERGRSDAEHEQQAWTRAAEAALGRPLSAIEVSDYYLDSALAYIRAHPGPWLRLSLKKWLMVWGAYECPDTEDYYLYQERSAVLRGLDRVWHFGVLGPAAIAGLVLTWPRRRELWLFYGWLLLTAAGVALFVVFARYRVSLLPVLAWFAAAGAVAAWDRIRAGRVLQLLPALGVAALAAVVINWPLYHQRRPYPESYTNHGAALAAQHRYAEDLAELHKALALAPDDVDVHLALGNTLVQLQRFDEALQHYERARLGAPDYGGAYRGLGRALSGMSRFDEATAQFRRALELDPRDAAALSGLATLAARRQEYAQALALFDQALQIDPTLADAQLNRANTLLALGRTADALTAYARAEQLDPANADVPYNLGVAHLLLGQTAEALACFRRAVTLDPQRPDFQAALERATRAAGIEKDQ